MLTPTQHLNNVRLPMGEHHTLSIAQYGADTYCEIALYDNRVNKAVRLPRLYKHSDAVAYTTDSFHYVTSLELIEIISSAHEFIKQVEEFDVVKIVSDAQEWVKENK